MFPLDQNMKSESHFKKLYNSLLKKDVSFPQRDHFFNEEPMITPVYMESSNISIICNELEVLFYQIIEFLKASDFFQCNKYQFKILIIYVFL